jgi:hypothetical protein
MSRCPTEEAHFAGTWPKVRKLRRKRPPARGAIATAVEPVVATQGLGIVVLALAALVEVLDVSLCDFDADQLHGRGIDTPRAGDEGDTYALDIFGWVLGRRPLQQVQFTHGGVRLWQVPFARRRRADIAAAFPGVPDAEGSGFRATIGTLRLPPEFELLIRAPFEDGGAADVAMLRGRRARLRLDREPRIQPLIITAFGRSGTTAVTRMLESLPSVVAYETYRREPSVAVYWMEVLTALAEPGSYRRQIMHARTAADVAKRGPWWLGSEMHALLRDDALYDEPVQRLIGVAGVQSLAAFCESRISAFYEWIATERRGTRAEYFVEKCQPGTVPQVLWDVYPGAREVILVRDFRDMAASMLAFGAKRNRPFFGRGDDKSDAEFIQRIGRAVSGLVSYRQSGLGRSFLLRYEDLILRPDDVLPALLRYLNVEASEQNVTTLHQAFLARSETTEAHRTAGLEASIGRWQRDFDAELRSVCEQAFGPALKAFGYAPDDSEAAPVERD